MSFNQLHQAMFAHVMPHFSAGASDSLFKAIDHIDTNEFSAEDLSIILQAEERWHSRWVDAKANVRDHARFSTRDADSSFGQDWLNDVAEEWTARAIQERLGHISWYARHISLGEKYPSESQELLEEAIASLREIAALCDKSNRKVASFMPPRAP